MSSPVHTRRVSHGHHVTESLSRTTFRHAFSDRHYSYIRTICPLDVTIHYLVQIEGIYTACFIPTSFRLFFLSLFFKKKSFFKKHDTTSWVELGNFTSVPTTATNVAVSKEAINNEKNRNNWMINVGISSVCLLRPFRVIPKSKKHCFSELPEHLVAKKCQKVKAR